jgi:hypothetical protein
MTCRICLQDLAPDDKQPANTPTGRESRRLRSRELYAKARAVINEMKSKPCMDCGGSYPTYVMQFDHRDPSTKIGDVGTICGSGHLPWILKEAAKCDVVCSNCHIMRTYRQRQAGIVPPAGRPLKD